MLVQCAIIFKKEVIILDETGKNQKTVFTMRIDKKEKEALKKLYGDMGIDLTTAVKIFFKQSLVKNGLPFRPTRDKSINIEARKEAENNKLKAYDNIDELWADLNNED